MRNVFEHCIYMVYWTLDSLALDYYVIMVQEVTVYLSYLLCLLSENLSNSEF